MLLCLVWWQGIITEGEGSVQLNSVYKLVQISYSLYWKYIFHLLQNKLSYEGGRLYWASSFTKSSLVVPSVWELRHRPSIYFISLWLRQSEVRAQFYKTFYVHNLRMVVINWSVWSWQASPVLLTNIRQGWKGLPRTNTLAYFKHL